MRRGGVVKPPANRGRGGSQTTARRSEACEAGEACEAEKRVKQRSVEGRQRSLDEVRQRSENGAAETFVRRAMRTRETL